MFANSVGLSLNCLKFIALLYINYVNCMLSLTAPSAKKISLTSYKPRLKTMYVAMMSKLKKQAITKEEKVNMFNLLSTMAEGFLKRLKQV